MTEDLGASSASNALASDEFATVIADADAVVADSIAGINHEPCVPATVDPTSEDVADAEAADAVDDDADGQISGNPCVASDAIAGDLPAAERARLDRLADCVARQGIGYELQCVRRQRIALPARSETTDAATATDFSFLRQPASEATRYYIQQLLARTHGLIARRPIPTKLVDASVTLPSDMRCRYKSAGVVPYARSASGELLLLLGCEDRSRKRAYLPPVSCCLLPRPELLSPSVRACVHLTGWLAGWVVGWLSRAAACEGSRAAAAAAEGGVAALWRQAA
eukprot:TRINITY_DN28129_c0_g1_i1.p1 TRINITY_DN28129_c0_g1~~TRINITY_DN28129_c0_g1_i1.p1  ORF type:complete len:282 (+),score=72.08 TRINITY_DN28129_c0_g1_i1:276-1121(+)